MRGGKYGIQYPSLLFMIVPFRAKSGHAHAAMAEKQIPKLPRSPGPNTKWLALGVKCWHIMLMLYWMNNLLNKSRCFLIDILILRQ